MIRPGGRAVLLVHACPKKRERVEVMVANTLPVSLGADGLRSDSADGKHLLLSTNAMNAAR